MSRINLSPETSSSMMALDSITLKARRQDVFKTELSETVVLKRTGLKGNLLESGGERSQDW